MKILVTNDDGIYAPGLIALAKAASKFGEVKIFAPDTEKSACGHSLTVHHSIRVKPVILEGFEAHQVTGTPTDCVNIGIDLAWRGEKCDLLLSGFNHGPNTGLELTYSGTVAAAMEGAIHGIKSIALSMAVYTALGDPHYETGVQWLTENFKKLVELPFSPPNYLNVNIPAISFKQIKGIKVAKKGHLFLHGNMESRIDPWQRPYFWYQGRFYHEAFEEKSDGDYITKGYVSITPLKVDWTDYEILETIKACLN